MYVFCNVWLCECMGFVLCGCVYVRVIYCSVVCMYRFFNVCVCVVMCFLVSGCVYVWVL